MIIKKQYKFLNDKNKTSFKEDVWDIFVMLSEVIRDIDYYLKDIKKFDNYA